MAYTEEDEGDQDEEMTDEDGDRDYMSSFRVRLRRKARALTRMVPGPLLHDIEHDWDDMAKAFQDTGNHLGAARLRRLNGKARSLEVDLSEGDTPRNRLCEDFVAAVTNLAGPTGSHGKQFAGVRRVRKIKVIIEDFGGVGEDEATKDLEEADEEWMYVATMEE